MSWFDDLLESGTADKLLNLGISTGIEYFGLNDPKGIDKQGYQEPVPEYDFVQERVPGTYDPNRRPGSAGQRYFTQGRYAPRGSQPGPLSAIGLASLNQSNPARQARSYGLAPRMAGKGQVPFKNPPPYVNYNMPGNPPGGIQQPGFISKGFARGGVAAVERDKYIAGDTDGMADKVPATVDGVQRAALSDGEFVVSADVVSHLGNGNSEAGAEVLYDMMDRVRKARTGTKKQGKKINPRKMLPA